MPKKRDILSLMKPKVALTPAYWADLRKLAEADLSGKLARPPFTELHAFLLEEHGVQHGITTTQNHYHKVFAECQAK